MQKVVVRGGGRKEGEGGVVGRKEKGWAETVYLMRFGERKPELLGQGKAEKGRHTFLNNGGYTHLICPPKEKGMGGGGDGYNGEDVAMGTGDNKRFT